MTARPDPTSANYWAELDAAEAGLPMPAVTRSPDDEPPRDPVTGRAVLGSRRWRSTWAGDTTTASSSPSPCCKCGGDGVRDIGTSGYCTAHLAEFVANTLTAIDQHACRDGNRQETLEQETLTGAGRQAGELLPEFGATWMLVRCDMCGASWGGRDGDSCGWCERALDDIRRYQREMLLSAPDLEPDDARYGPALTAWAERISRGVAAELITERDADRAWKRAVSRGAA